MEPKRYRRKPFLLEHLLSMAPVEVEAVQLIGGPPETMAVCEWVRGSGYPWLLGDATQPKTLIPEGSDKPGGVGIYLDPATGEFVIHNTDGNSRAKYGDWVIRFGEGNIITCKGYEFDAMYEVI